MNREYRQALIKAGARVRLAELVTERGEIVREFPDLGATDARPSARRRTVSEAARRAMSRGMRRYWRERRKAGK